jgi:long-chain acyl-CoA synthetase
VLLHEIIEFAAIRAPQTEAVVAGDRSLTYRELHDRIGRVASAVAATCAPGSRVAILSENTVEYVECYYGVPRAGRVLTLLNYRLHPLEWVRMLGDSGAAVLVGEHELLDALAPHLDECPALTTIVATDLPNGSAAASSFAGPPRTVLAYEAWLDGASPAEPDRAASDGAVAWLIYTSGTTGRPKGAMLTHRNLVTATTATAIARPIAPDDVYLFPFPLCHVAGYNVLLFHLHARPVVLMRRFDADGVLDAIARHRVTACSLAPTMIDVLCEQPRLAAADLSSLRSIGYGASGIPGPVLRRAVERLGCDLSQGYGMTELAGNGAYLGPDEHRRAAAGDDRLLRAAGWPSPLIALRVVDEEGRDAAPGGTGEIVARGDQVSPGYWNDPDATAAAWAGGWFHTGDLGRLDADGLLTVVDRKKDIIVTGGENVASREVEEVLAAHPGVREVAVVGVPDERWGEAVCAVVVARAGVAVTAEELIDHTRARLAGYKKPRHVLFVDELPKNTTGKIQKPDLRALAARLVPTGR